MQLLAYLVTAEMDKSRTLEKQKLAANSPGRGMTVRFRRIIESLKDIVASQQMTVHLQVIVQGHDTPFSKGWGHFPQTL